MYVMFDHGRQLEAKPGQVLGLKKHHCNGGGATVFYLFSSSFAPFHPSPIFILQITGGRGTRDGIGRRTDGAQLVWAAVAPSHSTLMLFLLSCGGSTGDRMQGRQTYKKLEDYKQRNRGKLYKGMQRCKGAINISTDSTP